MNTIKKFNQFRQNKPQEMLYLGIFENINLGEKCGSALFTQYNTFDKKLYNQQITVYFKRFVVFNDNSSNGRIRVDLKKSAHVNAFKNFLSRTGSDKSPAIFKIITDVPYDATQNYLVCKDVILYSANDNNWISHYTEDELNEKRQRKVNYPDAVTDEEKLSKYI